MVPKLNAAVFVLKLIISFVVCVTYFFIGYNIGKIVFLIVMFVVEVLSGSFFLHFLYTPKDEGPTENPRNETAV